MTLAFFSRGEFIDRILGYLESMGGLINTLSVCVECIRNNTLSSFGASELRWYSEKMI